MTKQGAMFGLDARIALAIFGALSVISGAALYSAIQDAKITSLIVEIEETGKAFFQYKLDTYEYPPRLSTNPSDDIFYYFKVKHLIEKPANVNNWNGPYLNSKTIDNYLDHDFFGQVSLIEISDDPAWGNTTNISGHYCKSANIKCFLWYHFTKDDLQFLKDLELKFNEPNTPNSGKIRWYTVNDGKGQRVFYKLDVIKNPNS